MKEQLTNKELFEKTYERDTNTIMIKSNLDRLSKKDLNNHNTMKEINQALESLHKRRNDIAWSYNVNLEEEYGK